MRRACGHAASAPTYAALPAPTVLDAASTTPNTPKCPPEMALVPEGSNETLCVDRYEEALEGRRFSEPVDEVDASTLKAVPAQGKMPQVNISETQAEAACEADAKRLCTQSEWRTACEGPSKVTYPYGNDHQTGACNEGKARPTAATSGKLNDPSLAETPGGIAPGGSFTRCVSPFGIYDMHGNVHEWVSDSSKPDDPRYGMFLGGFFADGNANGEGCAYKTTAHFKEYHDYSTGFRCCKDAR